MTCKTKFTFKNLSIGLLASAAAASVQAQTQTQSQTQSQTQPLPPVQNAAPAPSMAPALTGVYVVGNMGSTAINDLG